MTKTQELVSKLEALMDEIAAEMNDVVTEDSPEFETAFDDAIMSVQQAIDCLNEVA
jgi:hypothetical protein